jgi:hypothetical protein
VGPHLLAVEDLLQKHSLAELQVTSLGETQRRLGRQAQQYVSGGHREAPLLEQRLDQLTSAYDRCWRKFFCILKPSGFAYCKPVRIPSTYVCVDFNWPAFMSFCTKTLMHFLCTMFCACLNLLDVIAFNSVRWKVQSMKVSVMYFYVCEMQIFFLACVPA